MLNYGQKRIRNQSPTKGGKKCWYRIFEMLTHFVNLMKYFLIFDRRYLRREGNCNSPTTCCSTNQQSISGRRKPMMLDKTTIKLPTIRTPNTSSTWVGSVKQNAGLTELLQLSLSYVPSCDRIFFCHSQDFNNVNNQTSDIKTKLFFTIRLINIKLISF